MTPQTIVQGRGAMLAEVARAQSEKTFQAELVKYARNLGWLVWFTQRSTHSPKGEPDLRLVSATRKRMVWVECKSMAGRLSHDQAAGIWELRAAGETVYVWRPCDWPEIIEVLA